jgi:hypothetical protein
MSSPIPAPPPVATATRKGLVSVNSQTFSGLKTFVSGVIVSGSTIVSGTIVSTTGGFMFPDGTIQRSAATSGITGAGSTSRMPYWSGASNLTYASSIQADNTGLRFGIDGSTNVGWIGFGINGSNANLKIGDISNGYGFSAYAGIFYSDNFYGGSLGWGFIDGGSGNQLLIIRADSQSVGVGMHPGAGYKLDVNGKIKSRSGGVELPDGSVITSAADVAAPANPPYPLQGAVAPEGAASGITNMIGGLAQYMTQGSSFQNFEWRAGATGKPGAWCANMVVGSAGLKAWATTAVQGTQRPDSWPVVRIVALANDGSTSRRWWGMCTDPGTLLGEDSPSGGRKVIGIRGSDNVPDTNWQAICCNGGSVTTVNTGVPLSTAGFITLEIRYTSATSVDFYMNGSKVATISSNVPTGNADADRMYPFAGVYNLAATNASFQLHAMFVGRTDR